MRFPVSSLFATLALSACMSAETGGGAMPPGAIVSTDGYETYVTRHNGFTRIRRADPEPGDAAVLAQFEDADPASPAGFRSLLEDQSVEIPNRVNAEIIVEGATAEVIDRVLRLTTDVEAYNPAQIAAAGGEIVLSGSDYSLVRLGNGSYSYGQQSDSGSLYLALNFDTETATIHILNRELYHHYTGDPGIDSRVIDLLGEDLPFNIQTGLFGGEISGEVTQLYVRLGTVVVPVSGTLLGQVGGSARDDLVAGGVFEATGSDMAMGQMLDVRVDGVFSASN
ncbi:hypothetical protein [Pararhodobacter oceanensis]|nr:hypothetical protein [Pararhodobacter oceanensis]